MKGNASVVLELVPSEQVNEEPETQSRSRPKPNRVCQAMSRYSPFIAANLSMAVGNIAKQYVVAGISPNSAELSAIRGLIATGIVPIELGVANILYSSILKYRDSEAFASIQHNIGPIYQINLASSLLFVAASYIPIALSSNILSSPLLGLDLSATDLASLQTCFNWDYPIAILNAVYLADFLLFFQNRNYASAALTLFCGEVLDVAICALLTQFMPQLGLQSSAISDFAATLIAVTLSKMIQTGYVPKCLQSTFPSLAGFRLFDISAVARAKWPIVAKAFLKAGAMPWLASGVGNIAGTYSSLRFSSVSLQGALAVAEGACEDVTAVVLYTSSPDIAENSENLAKRRWAIQKQFLYASLPVLAVTGLSLAFPRPLSEMLGGADTASLSDTQLRTNIGLSMANLAVNLLESTMYATLVDCWNTNWPSAIVLTGSVLNIGLCYAFNALLLGESTVGNYANLSSSLISLLLMALYWARTSSCNHSSRPAPRESFILYNDLTQAERAELAQADIEAANAARAPLLEGENGL